MYLPFIFLSPWQLSEGEDDLGPQEGGRIIAGVEGPAAGGSFVIVAGDEVLTQEITGPEAVILIPQEGGEQVPLETAVIAEAGGAGKAVGVGEEGVVVGLDRHPVGRLDLTADVDAV